MSSNQCWLPGWRLEGDVREMVAGVLRKKSSNAPVSLSREWGCLHSIQRCTSGTYCKGVLSNRAEKLIRSRQASLFPQLSQGVLNRLLGSVART